MKNQHLIIIVLGLLLIYITYQLKYHHSIATIMIWIGLIFTGLLLFLITLIKNIIRFKQQRRFFNFFTTYLILGFALIICGIEYQNQSNLNAPTLLKASYFPNLTETSIDLKKNGTFIVVKSHIESAYYTYGTYTISGNKITLDKSGIENVIVTDKLEIRGKSDGGGRTENYLYQIDKNGEILPEETEFKVTKDNRRQTITLKPSTK